MAKKRIKTRTRIAGFTSDSGVVISGAQYRELHGERPARRRRISGAKLHKEEPRNIFAEIANMKETRLTPGRKMVRCEYCHGKVRRDRIENHTRKVHHTDDLRFRPIGDTVSAGENKRNSSQAMRTSLLNKSNILDDTEKSDAMAQMRREGNGQFGSFPLHDDYSDESDAD